MYTESSVECTAKVGTLLAENYDSQNDTRLGCIAPKFLAYGLYDLNFSPQTIDKYREALKVAVRDMGNLPVEAINLTHFTELKQKIIERGSGPSRIAGVVFAMKSLLKYCADVLELQVIDHKKIRAPKSKRREVIFLTNAEIQQFVDSIKFTKCWTGNTRKKGISVHRLRFRTLVEVLLGTGMRISEALSLKRDTINFEKKEAKIIGKGNKERIVFFSQRALSWVKYYLQFRTDNNPVLFLNQRGEPLNRGSADSLFQRYAVRYPFL